MCIYICVYTSLALIESHDIPILVGYVPHFCVHSHEIHCFTYLSFSISLTSTGYFLYITMLQCGYTTSTPHFPLKTNEIPKFGILQLSIANPMENPQASPSFPCRSLLPRVLPIAPPLAGCSWSRGAIRCEPGGAKGDRPMAGNVIMYPDYVQYIVKLFFISLIWINDWICWSMSITGLIISWK